MKLLFDQNLSHRLLGELEDVFSGSAHVRRMGLAEADAAPSGILRGCTASPSSRWTRISPIWLRSTVRHRR